MGETTPLAARPVAAVSAHSRSLLLFCAVHLFVLFAIWWDVRLGLGNNPWARALIVIILAGNPMWLWLRLRELKAVTEPGSSAVPGRLRKHLIILRVAERTLAIGLIITVPLAGFFLLHTARYPAVQLLPVVICPAILAVKLRWITNLHRRMNQLMRLKAAA